jgi:SAM-dependent methyltransferase
MNDQQFKEAFDEISAHGERVSHLYPNDVYFAHLSIYHFALRFCIGKTVLDAGSGAGYGSAYLAKHGARSVEAFDIEEKAVAFSRYHFSKPNLSYQVMGIEEIKGFPKQHFDVIFTSNALEHVANVIPFFRSAQELLKPEGILIVAVPPIVNELLRQGNLDNPFHLNIWTPRQWFHVLKLFFSEVQPYLHHFYKPGLELNLANTPKQTRVKETDFIFDPISVEGFYRPTTLTAIFVAQKPTPESTSPSPTLPLNFIEGSFTRPLVVNPQGLNVTGNPSSTRYMQMIRTMKRAWEILCQDGLMALIRRTKSHLSAR